MMNTCKIWRSFRGTLIISRNMANREAADLQESKTVTKVVEGRATIVFPSKNEVFYNPVQEFNRDLSVAVLRHFIGKWWKAPIPKQWRKQEKAPTTDTEIGVFQQQSSKVEDSESDKLRGEDMEDESRREKDISKSDKDIRILEALSATGLRSLRYALEVPDLREVIANDISLAAFEAIQRNIDFNQLSGKVTAHCEDASIYMYKCRNIGQQFTVVDLDPYGSAAIFLDPAVQATEDGGLLCVTCTDTAVLCGTHFEACFAKYGSMPIKAKHCHEMALRILLSAIELQANRYQRYIVPLLSCSIDFYVRVFVQVFTSRSEVHKSSSKKAMFYHCIGCENFHLQPIGRDDLSSKSSYPAAFGPPVGEECENCGSKFKFGGPIWRKPIHNVTFVAGLLEDVKSCQNDFSTWDRMVGLLSVCSEEVPEAPLFHKLDHICKTLHCNPPKMLVMRSAILNQGYNVSISHTNANAVKTDAPHEVIWDIMRCWVKQNPVKNIKESSVAAKILSKEPKIAASFEIRKDANPPSRSVKLLRFPENPEDNWGPKARAGKMEDLTAKRASNQGKRSANQDSPDLKKYSCKRFAIGLCEKGKECRYSHPSDTPNQPSSSHHREPK